MRPRIILFLTAILTWAYPCVAGENYVIAPPERTAGVTVEEAEAYYQAVVDQLSSHKNVSISERKQLKLVLREQDLSAALGSDSAAQTYANACEDLPAKEVLVPSLCKVGDDFVVSLRMIHVQDGSTRLCATHRTRVVAKFKDKAALQVEQLLSRRATTGPSNDADVLPLKEARQACVDAKADRLFPAMWQRTEKLRGELKPEADCSGVMNYYVMLLHLSARAANPPPGMVFVPGGFVAMGTVAGKRELWVEPFFMDRCEISVALYSKYLEQAAPAGKAGLRALTPITKDVDGFKAPDLPVTGLSWNAADAYARRQGRQLPTALQWMRAAYGDDDREYPCGDVIASVGANLKGDAPGSLSPAAKPGDDESPFGVLGMTGNVREWTCSWYAKDAYAQCPSEAPVEPASGTMKVVKGGSFRMGKERASRSAGADMCKCGEACDDLGFRCVAPFFLSPQAAERTTQDNP